MEPIKKYNVDDMRSMAARYIHSIFKGAVAVNALYKDTFVQASCVWKDGVREYVMLFYRDIESSLVSCGQHDRAVEYINTITG